MNYKRLYLPGQCYFFTVVTYRRQPLFKCKKNIEMLRLAFRETKAAYPFEIDAMVVLPDHLHCLWRLPKTDSDYSTRWRVIKSRFTRRAPDELKFCNNPSRSSKGERPIWQRRFWEHAIRNEDDYQKHLDYIHYNPVKHGLCAMARDWPYSSFSKFAARGYYDVRWGMSENHDFKDVGKE